MESAKRKSGLINVHVEHGNATRRLETRLDISARDVRFTRDTETVTLIARGFSIRLPRALLQAAAND